MAILIRLSLKVLQTSVIQDAPLIDNLFLGRTVFSSNIFLVGWGRLIHLSFCRKQSSFRFKEKWVFSFLETNCSPFDVPVTLIYLTGGIKWHYIHYFPLSVNTPDFSCSVIGFFGFAVNTWTNCIIRSTFNPVWIGSGLGNLPCPCCIVVFEATTFKNAEV